MATPSSSATSPSPPMAYLSHAQLPPPPTSSPPIDAQEREQRKKAVQKFLARAEISMVTRALRARLSYASYKATHNIPHVPLRDLEAQSQTQSQSASFSRTIAAKRKAAGSANYYNNPATQPTNGIGAGSSGQVRRGGSGAMAPPTSSPRTHYPSPQSSASAAASEYASSSRNPALPNSLYASILAPPPTKQARTIHNASDPPVPAPTRPAPSPRVRTVKASPRTATADRHGKARQTAKASATSPDTKRKAKRASHAKGKQKEKRPVPMDVDGDVDMKAAATLTSLLLHHRPSIAGSASSPRSSIDGSETGSAYSYSHFAQSSARTTTGVSNNTSTGPPPLAPPANVAVASVNTGASPSALNSTQEPAFRSQTPPGQQSTRAAAAAAPTDNEAADLMLFLATSPSPARASTSKESRDMAAYRALGGGPEALRAKGRVLFSAGAGEPPGGADAPPGGNGGPSPSLRMPPGLARAAGAEGSFNSSISSIGAELGGGNASTYPHPMPANANFPHLPLPTRTSNNNPGSGSHLLPPHPVPLLPPPTSPGRKDATRSPKSAVYGHPQQPHQQQQQQPQQGMTGEFNFNDFINASPSPSRGTAGTGHKANLGLRADVGRKLFEEEQMRHAMGAQKRHQQQQYQQQHQQQQQYQTQQRQQPQQEEERGLGAGINLQS